MPTVVLIGTLDTKGHEYAYLRDRVREQGVDTLLVDAGVFEPQTEPDVGRQEVAAAAGADVEALAEAGDRGAAVEAMARGAADAGRAAARGGPARRDRHDRRLGQLVDRRRCDARAPGRRPQADRLHRRLRRHAAVHGRVRRDDDLLGRRHRRHQPDLGADPDQRGRGDRGHGQGRGAGPRRAAAARHRLDVRRHDAVRDAGARAARGARLRGARLPPDRHGRRVDGGARSAPGSSRARST